MKVNIEKTKVMHVKQGSVPRSNHVFIFSTVLEEYCDKYRYLGMDINEHVNSRGNLM